MSEFSRIESSWIEIDLDRLAANFHTAKEFIGNVNYLAVIKANAYGHGAVECARRLETEGIHWFGVATAREALELRSAGITKPILCFAGFPRGSEVEAITADVRPVIFSAERLREINQAAGATGLKAAIHIEIDTGMGRVGVRYDEIEQILNVATAAENVTVEGLMTHFASAEDPDSDAFTAKQIDRFNICVSQFAERGFTPKILDLSNSPGAVRHPSARATMVRLGGLLYGMSDFLPPGVEISGLKPVLSLHSRIDLLKKVPQGETLGYNRTFTAARDSVIATVPIGYADGFRRGLSNNAAALVGGRRVPVVGRVSMDWTLLDVTDVINVKVNDEVIFIGEQKGQTIGVEDLAAALKTISYEITCGIGQRVARVYKGQK